MRARQLLAPLLCVLVAAHVLVPALPVFVCAAMGGARSLAPCCPALDAEDEGGGAAGPAFAARCCRPTQPAAPVALQAPGTRLPEYRALVLAAPPPGATAAFAHLRTAAASACPGVPPPGLPPPPLRRVLRI